MIFGPKILRIESTNFGLFWTKNRLLSLCDLISRVFILVFVPNDAVIIILPSTFGEQDGVIENDIETFQWFGTRNFEGCKIRTRFNFDGFLKLKCVFFTKPNFAFMDNSYCFFITVTLTSK